MLMARILKCPRCIGGQIFMQWGELSCVQCGYRPREAVPLAKEKGKREPRLNPKVRT